MADYTKNYNLKKPLPNELYDVEDQNGNMDILDTMLAEHQKNTAVHLPEDGILPVERGGTGGVTAADARANLGAASNPNLLDNWYFADPINQRGRDNYDASGYCIDRWYAPNANSSNEIKIDNGIVLNKQNTSSSASLKQRLENPSFLAGKTVTISVLCDSEPKGKLKVYISDSQDLKTTGSHILVGLLSEKFETFTVEIPETFSGINVMLYINDNTVATVKVVAIKLEIGSQQTIARQENGVWVLNDVPPNKALELEKCQRYFQTFATQSLRPTDENDFRPVMRTTPALGTISVNGKTRYTASADL
ncbi:MAG: hypothetical protein ACI4TP_02110 [Anaerotignum sp.]